MAAVLLQKNDEGLDHPIAFFSKTLRNADLKYDPIEKQAYALIKSLKTFKIYILHAKFIAYVPSTAIKDVLTQPDIDGKRAKWISKLIEFDVVGNNSQFQLIIQMQMPIFIHFMRRLITSLFDFLSIHIPIIYLQ